MVREKSPEKALFEDRFSCFQGAPRRFLLLARVWSGGELGGGVNMIGEEARSFTWGRGGLWKAIAAGGRAWATLDVEEHEGGVEGWKACGFGHRRTGLELAKAGRAFGVEVVELVG